MNDYRAGIEATVNHIALVFFATFSRFEFALKRSGYVSGQIGHKVSPNWNLFGNQLGVPFFEQMKNSAVARIFFYAPPKRLILTADSGVEFCKQPAPVNTQTLLEAVCLVRNNLFHGEKPTITERDERLLHASLYVLDSAYVVAQKHDEMQKFCKAFPYSDINQH